MIKVLIFSDSHGYNQNMKKIIEKVSPVDFLIHLGDLQTSISDLKQMAGCPVYAVAGNNDYGYDLPKQDIFQIGGYQIAITHGHRQRVYYGTEFMKEWGRENGADIVMFGHTHMPCLERSNDITVLNPGSISLPRQEGNRPTYAIMEIDNKNEAHFTINECK